MGPHEGAPVAYHWSIWWHIVRLLPWAAWLAALATKRNRRERGWTVLIPVLGIHALILWPIYYGLTSFMPGFEVLVENASVAVLAVGAIWALSHLFESMTRIAAFGVAALIALIFGLLAAFAAVDGIPAYIVIVSSVLLAMVAAGFSCRKRYTMRRFICWILGWSLVPVVLVFLILTVLALFLTEGALDMMIFLMFQVVVMSLFATVGIYIVILPFVELTLHHGTYRSRFYRIFRLPGMEETPTPPPLPEYTKEEASAS